MLSSKDSVRLGKAHEVHSAVANVCMHKPGADPSGWGSLSQEPAALCIEIPTEPPTVCMAILYSVT